MKSRAYWEEKKLNAKARVWTLTHKLERAERSLVRVLVEGRPDPPKSILRRRQRKRPHVKKELKSWKTLLRNRRNRIQELSNLKEALNTALRRQEYIEARLEKMGKATRWQMMEEDPFTGKPRLPRQALENYVASPNQDVRTFQDIFREDPFIT